MKVFIGKTAVAVKEKACVRDALNALALNVETYIVKRNGEIITENDTLESRDKLQLIKLVSRG